MDNSPQACEDQRLGWTRGLQARRALVIGAGSVIGTAVAIALLQEGVTVYLAGPDTLTTSSEASGIGAVAVQLDVTSPESCEDAIVAVTRGGPLDFVVNCAGLGQF